MSAVNRVWPRWLFVLVFADGHRETRSPEGFYETLVTPLDDGRQHVSRIVPLGFEPRVIDSENRMALWVELKP